MKRYICILLLLAFLQSAAGRRGDLAKRPSPKPYSECDEPGDEFFYLVQQWAPGFCGTEYCPSIAPAKYTIHGFWPNYCQLKKNGTEYPQFCSGEKLDLAILADLVPTMKEEWPSLTDKGDVWFWEHEWHKHGTCALAYTPFGLDSQHDYFATTLALHQKTNLLGNLAAQGITPGGEYTVVDFQNALVNTLGGAVFLYCEKDNVLVEIYVCYNQQLELVACSQQGDCDSRKPVQYLEGNQIRTVAADTAMGVED